GVDGAKRRWYVGDLCVCFQEFEYYIELFFFSSRRRHTRFDCDWSSDVCSSDLAHSVSERDQQHGMSTGGNAYMVSPIDPEALLRSEERRVGKECRSRWSPYQ